jgi:hypothetical protein
MGDDSIRSAASNRAEYARNRRKKSSASPFAMPALLAARSGGIPMRMRLAGTSIFLPVKV